MRTSIIAVQRALSSFQHPDRHRFIGGSKLNAAARTAAKEDYDTLCGDLSVVPAPSNNGECRDPLFETETNPLPPGGLTNLTPGLTDRVQQALSRARTTTASAVINGQVPGAHLVVDRDLDGSKQEGYQHG